MYVDEANNQTFPITFQCTGTYPATGYECTDATNTFTWNFNDGSPLVTELECQQLLTLSLNVEDIL